MLIQKAQIYLPWIAVGLCIVVGVTYVATRPARESYDQCVARQTYPEQSDADHQTMVDGCAARAHVQTRVVGQ